MKGGGGDGSDVGRSSFFMGGSLAMSTHPSLAGTHHVCGHSSFICGEMLSSVGDHCHPWGIVIVHGRG